MARARLVNVTREQLLAAQIRKLAENHTRLKQSLKTPTVPVYDDFPGDGVDGQMALKAGLPYYRSDGEWRAFAAVADWVEFEEPYDNDWEYPGGTAVRPAWKLNPNPGKHPFLRGAVEGGTSGTSPFTLPSEAGAPFDGDFISALAFTTEDGIAITKVDGDGVVYVTTFTVGEAGDVTVDDADGNFTATNVEDALAELATMISDLSSVYQPLDTDLSSIAALTTTTYGRALLTLSNLAALYTLLGVDTDGTLAANSDTKLATQKAAKTYMDGRIAAQDAMVFKGVIDCSANPNYPAADRGHTYRVSVAGKIGGGSGPNVEAGDLLICLTDSTSSGNHATVGSAWTIAQTNLDGAVIGPASSTAHRLAAFADTSGKLLEEATVTGDDVEFDPTGTDLSSTTVQDAIVEVAELAAEGGGGGGGGAPEIKIRAVELIPSASGGASGPNAGAFGTKTVVTIDFVDGSDTTAECDVQMPPDWDGGPLKGEVSWFAGGTDPDDVEFGVELLSLGDGDPDDSFGTEVTIDDTHPADAATLAVSNLSDNVTPAGTPAIGNRMFVRLTRHGATDELAQTVKVLGLRLAYTQGDIVPPPTIPEWISTGTPAAVAASPGDIVLAYPDLIHEDDLLIAQIYSRSASATLDTVPAGWSAMPISGMPDAQSSVMQQWLYYKWADGTETTSDTETWSATGTLPLLGRVHCFRGVDMSTMLESTTKASAANTTVAHASITSTADNRLAVCMYCSPDDHGTSVFAGQTGGTWEAAGTDFTTTLGSDAMFGMQTADMPSAGTMSGGTFTLTGGSSNAWIARTFALIPIGG